MNTHIKSRHMILQRAFSRTLVFLFFAGCYLAGAQQTFAQDSKELVADVARLIGDDNRARLLIEFNNEPKFSIRYLDTPYRIVIDLKKTRFNFLPEDLEPRGILADLRYGSMSDVSSRMVLTLKQSAVLESEELQELEDGRYRLVLDISSAPESVFESILTDQKWDSRPKSGKSSRVLLSGKQDTNTFVIVLDAGHGGIDGGAEGRNGTSEKEVTLAFVLALRDALADLGDAKVVLTRDSDKFISLASRVQIARREHADLFISVHADSIRQRNLRGASVYTLSQKATDAVTESLAESENLTDVIAGLQIEDASDEVTGILIDLARRETKQFSESVADQIVGSFKGQVQLINNPHRRAGFRVLQAPDVPSILIELGFLSNLTDEKLLSNPEWRSKAAKLLAQSITDYKSVVMQSR
ncbi:N-acetylmuramoyl-L-alanine amidase [Lentilitoribacter sp. Alg239-R112]|uniref:N-acetylmuramoyl-L-alanine amidase n=1 Tax=Lentilitoribacter sp. Alg239-R112 TaxID=2305987 RepID=UPI001FCEA799|nr:N-acetylmuramoyl-L-alanine amidase [Lentilitoribacter sp. Alg239-R112]